MATEKMRWLAIYSKETANGGPDRTGQWVVLLDRDARLNQSIFPTKPRRTNTWRSKASKAGSLCSRSKRVCDNGLNVRGRSLG